MGDCTPRGTKWSIPAGYNNIRMRSPLEAEYARFFDLHQIRWAYMTFDLVHLGSLGWTCHDCPDCGAQG